MMNDPQQQGFDAAQEGAPPPRRRRGTFKLALLLLVFVAGFGVIAARLFTVQVIEGDDLRARAKRQYESRIELAADRGRIFDSKGKEIATTLRKMSIAVDPGMLENPLPICRALDSLTGRPDSVYLERISQSDSRFVWLGRALDRAEFSSLASNEDPGLIRRWEAGRQYAYGTLAAQIVGFTNVDNHGLSGIELRWDTVLRGRPGYVVMQRDGRGVSRRKPDLPVIEPLKGHDIRLTLDMDIQGVVESELRQGVRAAEAESGTAVAIDPNTGAILAMASWPSFNPNNIATATAENARNRAITDMYEPGSTFKLVTAAALIEEDVVHSPDSVDGLGGSMRIADDHVIRDEVPLNRVTFAEAVEHSSNVVFASLVDSIRSDKFYKYVRDFGFGIYTGVDLPGEVRGILKKPRSFDHTTKSFMAYGYELAATALQIVNAYAVVANDGVMMRPYIVASVTDSDGDEVYSMQPQRIRRVIRSETAQELSGLLRGVVDHGSGSLARVPGLSIAGKTGTAQQLEEGGYSKRNYTASFVGFFPVESPRIALIIMLDKPRRGYYGGRVSAPIFQRIARRLVAAGLIEVPDPSLIAAAEPLDSLELETSPLVRVPDIRGLEVDEARTMLQQHGLRLESDYREGIVLTQDPSAGSTLEPGSIVQTRLHSTIVTAHSDSLPVLTQLHKVRPDVRGMTLRRALNLMHAARVKTRVEGSGKVVRQEWSRDGSSCLLICSSGN